jgi:hypothetical protein
MKNSESLVTFHSTDDLISLSVQLDVQQETVWLNLNRIAELFGRDKSVFLVKNDSAFYPVILVFVLLLFKSFAQQLFYFICLGFKNVVLFNESTFC